MLGWSQNITATKPETTVQDGISTFVSVKPLDILSEVLGNRPDKISSSLWWQKQISLTWHFLDKVKTWKLPGRRPLFKMAFQHLWEWNHWMFFMRYWDIFLLFVATQQDILMRHWYKAKTLQLLSQRPLFKKAFYHLKCKTTKMFFTWRPSCVCDNKTRRFRPKHAEQKQTIGESALWGRTITAWCTEMIIKTIQILQSNESKRSITFLIRMLWVSEKYSNEVEENTKGTTDWKMSFRSEDDSFNIIKLRHSLTQTVFSDFKSFEPVWLSAMQLSLWHYTGSLRFNHRTTCVQLSILK